MAESEKEGAEEEERQCGVVGAWPKSVALVRDGSEEVMLLWGLQQPTLHRPNHFVQQAGLALRLDACGHELSISQSPSSLSQIGVTGGVMWDSGVILAKFLEHSADSHLVDFHGKKVVELGSGCGLVGCVAVLLGAHVILTDLPDRLKLLQKNVRENLMGNARTQRVGAVTAAEVLEFTWGDQPDRALVDPQPDFVVASDVIYNEDVVPDLLHSLRALCAAHTTLFVAGELRNDAVLECFLDAAIKDFVVGLVPVDDWHPNFRSPRIALYVLCRRPRV
ncbi:unnamed protein product [Calypogeia fissa]